MRRWKLVGFVGIGAALLALGMLRSPGWGRPGQAGVTPPVRLGTREAPSTLTPEASVLRGALAVSFAASAHGLSAAMKPDLAPLPLDLAAAGVATGSPPAALPEPPAVVLGLALVAGLRALACRHRAI